MTTTNYYKLYVFSRNVGFSSQAVQSAHAVAQFVKEAPDHPWFHGAIVLLNFSGDEEAFRLFLNQCSFDESLDHITPWVERRELTAIAMTAVSYSRDTRFSEYKLLR